MLSTKLYFGLWEYREIQTLQPILCMLFWDSKIIVTGICFSETISKSIQTSTRKKLKLLKDEDALFYVDIDWCIGQTENKEMLELETVSTQKYQS